MKDFKTEAEANKLWCPMVRFTVGDERPSFNRISGLIKDPHPDMLCMGSSCMFWRWSHQDTGVNDAPTVFCGAAGLPKYI